MERTNISSYFTNNTYGGSLWDSWAGSILTYPSNQNTLNQLAMLQCSADFIRKNQQYLLNAQAQQRHQNLAAILAAGAIPDAGNWEMAERSQRIERRINEAGEVFDGQNSWDFKGPSREQAEDRINAELDNL